MNCVPAVSYSVNLSLYLCTCACFVCKVKLRCVIASTCIMYDCEVNEAVVDMCMCEINDSYEDLFSYIFFHGTYCTEMCTLQHTSLVTSLLDNRAQALTYCLVLRMNRHIDIQTDRQ